MDDVQEVWIERPLRVGVFGEFSAGKSSLLNSLLGSLTQATGVRPTTQHISIIRDARIVGAPGTSAQLVPHQSALLRAGLELWDTPGPNSENAQHTKLALDAAAQVELALILVPAVEGTTRSLVELYNRIRLIRTASQKSPPWLILTKWDRIVADDAEELAEVGAEIISSVEARLPGYERWFRVDGRRLDLLDGPALLTDLRRRGLKWSRDRLVLEVRQTQQHMLKREVALEREWRSKVPAGFESPALEQVMLEWASHCKAALVRRRRLWWRAVLGTPGEAKGRAECWWSWVFSVAEKHRLRPVFARAAARGRAVRESVGALASGFVEFAVGVESMKSPYEGS
ncbi:MAG: dynamin family protein [Deltaproteobacteria bacterium]|nr:dynamin family protein [Deltaproteobacteria bacterium]